MAEIKVFLRSTLLTGQLTALQYSYDYHYFMEKHFRGNYHWLRNQGFTKGQVFEPESAVLLPVLAQIKEINGVHLRLFDVNSVAGKVCGWRFGVWKTPSIILLGNKVVGKEDSITILKKIINDPAIFDQST